MPRITTWLDGDIGSPSTRRLQRAMGDHWSNEFPTAPPLEFLGVKNLKSGEDLAGRA